MSDIFDELGVTAEAIDQIVRSLAKQYRDTCVRPQPPTGKQVVAEWNKLQTACRKVLTAIDGLSDTAARAVRTAEPILIHSGKNRKPVYRSKSLF